MSKPTSDNLEEQSDSLALSSFKYTMWVTFAFIIVAVYITITTTLNEDLTPKLSKEEAEQHDHH